MSEASQDQVTSTCRQINVSGAGAAEEPQHATSAQRVYFVTNILVGSLAQQTSAIAELVREESKRSQGLLKRGRCA